MNGNQGIMSGTGRGQERGSVRKGPQRRRVAAGALTTLLVAAGLGAGVGAASASPGAGVDLKSVAGPVVRVAGEDRIDTGVAAAKLAYPTGGAAGAVIARADGFADALAGAQMDGQTGPMLLTYGASLDARVASELKRVVKAGGTVYVLGTTDVLSAGVQNAIQQLGFKVVRLGGADRYATAAIIAAQVQPTAAPAIGCQFTLVTGRDFPDAVTAAGGSIAPVLFTDGSTMPEPTVKEIDRCLATDRDLATSPTAGIAAVGGPAVAATTTYMRQRGGDESFVAVAGNDRYDTNARYLSSRSGNGEEAPRRLVVATGENYPDALVGAGTFAASSGARSTASVLVALTRPAELPTGVRENITGGNLVLGNAYVMGGSDVVSDNVLAQVAAAK